MNNNLVLPLIMREAAVKINSDKNIHSKQLPKKDNFTYFPKNDFKIPLSLRSVLSYFLIMKSSNYTLE